MGGEDRDLEFLANTLPLADFPHRKQSSQLLNREELNDHVVENYGRSIIHNTFPNQGSARGQCRRAREGANGRWRDAR